MKAKILREQVQRLFEIIDEDNLTRQEALDFLCDGEALAMCGITSRGAVDVVYDCIADDDDDFYHQRACADMEANR